LPTNYEGCQEQFVLVQNSHFLYQWSNSFWDLKKKLFVRLTGNFLPLTESRIQVAVSKIRQTAANDAWEDLLQQSRLSDSAAERNLSLGLSEAPHRRSSAVLQQPEGCHQQTRAEFQL
jgi:hypothetical protein